MSAGLFAPLAPWLADAAGALASATPPDLDQLNRWAASAVAPPLSGGGASIRFVPAESAHESYERQIHATGQVPTRAANWHDAFNALVWLAFPRGKAALNARHLSVPPGPVRGPLRDAATLFDECGVILLCSDASLAAALRAHAWREVFVTRRAEFMRAVRVLVFGHALYDSLRDPYPGLCGKWLALDAAPGALDLPLADLVRHADETLARALADTHFLAGPRALSPLPMLGLPGVCEANEAPAFYDDTRVFRPARGQKNGPA